MKIYKKHSEMPDQHIPKMCKGPLNLHLVDLGDRKQTKYCILYISPAWIAYRVCEPTRDLMACLNITPSIHPETYILQIRRDGRDVLVYKWYARKWKKVIVWLESGEK